MTKIPVMRIPGVHRLKVKNIKDEDGQLTGFHQIFLDDKELTGVTGLEIRMGINELTSVRLTMDVNVESVDALAGFGVEIACLEQKEEGEKSDG